MRWRLNIRIVIFSFLMFFRLSNCLYILLASKWVPVKCTVCVHIAQNDCPMCINQMSYSFLQISSYFNPSMRYTRTVHCTLYGHILSPLFENHSGSNNSEQLKTVNTLVKASVYLVIFANCNNKKKIIFQNFDHQILM